MACVIAALMASGPARGQVTTIFTQVSTPVGIVNSVTTNATGVLLSTARAPVTNAGYAFSYWTLNGVVQRDAAGGAWNPVVFTNFSHVAATATYFAVASDLNTNGVPDWWEYAFHDVLQTGAVVDADGDGLGLREEYRRATHPGLADTLAPGGVSAAFSGAELVLVNSNLTALTRFSEPWGLIAASTVVTGLGATVALPLLPDTNANYRFAAWRLNGTVVTDALGRAVRTASIVVTQRSEAVALFVGSTTDSDGDSIPDWYEWQFRGGLQDAGGGDVDGDGWTLLQEYRRDSHPGAVDDVRAGGISLACSAAGLALFSTNFVVLRQTSVPAGIVPGLEIVTNAGVNYALSAPAASNEFRFAYWSVNGIRLTNALGESIRTTSLPLSAVTVVQAVYADVSADSDGDRVPDWFEARHTGGTAVAPADDRDGDGWSFAQEYLRDQVPGQIDSIVPGGVSLCGTAPYTVLAGTNVALVAISSEPAEIVPSTQIVVTVGASVGLPAAPLTQGGFAFSCWRVDGVVLTDAVGRAVSTGVVAAIGRHTAQALYIDPSVDTDGDEVPDWYEWRYGGGIDRSASSDSDADGFSLREEYRRDLHAGIADSVAPGGLSMAVAAPVTIYIDDYALSRRLLVDGVPVDFFASGPRTSGAFTVFCNAAPAWGDWDGDFDADLFVGGATGVVRIFENTGSPVVPHLVERTTPLAPWAGIWSGVTNPMPALGDWNGDGLADLALGGGGSNVFLVPSTGLLAPVATATVVQVLGTGAAWSAPAFLDIGNDGLLDLLVLDDRGFVRVYANAEDLEAPFADVPAETNLLGLAVANARGITVADVNGDGRIDVLISDETGSIWDFLQDESGSFAPRSRIFAGTYEGFADRLTIAAVDLDGDGDIDITGGTRQGALIHLRNLSPTLLIAPPAATLLAGGVKTFAASNATGAVTWSMWRDPSGGQVDSTGGVYTAGGAAGVFDVIEGVDANGLRGLAYVNVIDAGDVAAAGRAILVAGGKSLDDPVWAATRYVTDLAYGTFQFCGYSKSNLNYLSFETGRDADGNGLDDDIAGPATLAALHHALTNWAPGASRLTLYLADHGSDVAGQGFFRLNAAEHLTATNLDAWLDAFQDEHNVDVTVILDFCFAGSFLDELTYSGTAQRIVLAATEPLELTYFIAGGRISFSEVFFTAVQQGFDLKTAFDLARAAMEFYQHPTFDDDGNGLYQSGVDGPLASGSTLGASFVVGRDIPTLGAVVGSHSITGDSTLVWAADIASAYPVDRVWCAVLAPGHLPATNTGVPVVDVPEVDLLYNAATRRYETVLTGLAEPGTYRLNFQARDIWGGVSLPRQSFVTQAGFDERCILFAGGDPGSAAWSNDAAMADHAYAVLRGRQFGDDRILYFCATNRDANGDGTNDVDAVSTAENFLAALTNWAAGAARLTVLFVGQATDNVFLVAGTNTLDAAALDAAFDEWQASNRALNVVLAFPGDGDYVTNCLPPAGRERIVLTSTHPWGGTLVTSGGGLSFSHLFWSGIQSGHTIGDAFTAARRAIRRASGPLRQRAQLDDDGNGLANQKNLDGLIARQRYIGTAFVTGDDIPLIGRVMPALALIGTNEATVWAADVTDVDGISNVWCQLSDPAGDPTSGPRRVDLAFSTNALRYEALATGLTNPGAYTLTFYAQDTKGVLSLPVQQELVRADAFEPDDDTNSAALVLGDVQAHTFHTTNDVDWVRFYALSNFAYDIETVHSGTNLDTALRVYRQETNGALTLLDTVDDAGVEEGELTGLDFPATGFYFVEVRQSGTNVWTPSGYELLIYIPAGARTVFVFGEDKLNKRALPGTALAYVGAAQKALGGAMAQEFQQLSVGWKSVGVGNLPAGYVPEDDPAAPGQVQNPANRVYGNPRSLYVYGEASTWTSLTFQFVPMMTVTGTVRDAFTGEYIDGVNLRWLAKAGVIAGVTYTQLPMNSAYGAPWNTASGGGFPANLQLPAVSMDLLMYKAGYSNFNAVGAIIDPPAGHHTPFGDVFLQPVDVNGNRIADTWETLYFGGLTSSTNDPDADGQNNRDEYWSGTNPTNAASVFKTAGLDVTNGLTIRWPVTPGRVYRVEATENLAGGTWTVLAGPWTAGIGETLMQWTVAGPTSTQRTYRIQVMMR